MKMLTSGPWVRSVKSDNKWLDDEFSSVQEEPFAVCARFGNKTAAIAVSVTQKSQPSLEGVRSGSEPVKLAVIIC